MLNLGNIIRDLATWLWGQPMLLFLTLVGTYFTIRLKGLQFKQFFSSGKLTYTYRTASGEGNITPLQSLFSALGGIIGNGNIAGAATAIAVGGPGALFWLWIATFIAMVIAYAETMLALLYREKSGDGTFSGGPMYYIDKVLKIRWLAITFALAMGFKTIMATATIQSNSISLAINSIFNIPMPYLCAALALLTWIVTVGGLSSIARTLEKLTPFMVILYFVTGISIIIAHSNEVIDMLQMVITMAFTPAGATGGFAGASVLMAIRYGVGRGFYSNEAGTGSSSIMFSTAQKEDPYKQSLIGMFGITIDTLVMTLTAFIILITGVWSSGETSSALTIAAFSTVFGTYGSIVILFSAFLFGFTSLITWCFYGEQCFAFIWGAHARKTFRWVFCGAIIFGFIDAETLWSVGDLLNAFTVIVNVIAVVLLIRLVVKKTFQIT